LQRTDAATQFTAPGQRDEHGGHGLQVAADPRNIDLQRPARGQTASDRLARDLEQAILLAVA
jgi:hypothetical protein